MRSPFPGMDPYLESRWPDVHASLIALVKETLQPILPRDLRARSEERVLLQDTEGDWYDRWSDIAVIEMPDARKTGARAPSTGVAVTIEPVIIDFDAGPPVERWVQIVDVRSGNRVVTAIEVLSPWNKRAGRGNKSYLKKLDDYLAARVNVVEIDLLRSPRDEMQVSEEDVPEQHRTPYMVGIRRVEPPKRWFIYPIRLRERLPVIPIPLRPGEADVMLDLQPLIDRVFVAGGHDDIDYSKPPRPPLDPGDAEWAAEVIRNAKRE
jgi:hypothetical protein